MAIETIIQIDNLSLHFGEQLLFDNVSCTIDRAAHIGIVGRNGSGKSTLFKIMKGMLKPDGGSVTVTRGATVGYLPQEVVLQSERSVFDEAMTVFDEFLRLEQEKDILEKGFASGSHDADKLERYQEILDKLILFDKQKALADTVSILTGLGFKQEMQQRPVSELSVGWRMRVVLAKLLLMNADFYLFDEPTNHLDIVAQEWFMHFLRKASFGYMLITHDRIFLERCVDRIMELERGRVNFYDGNFTAYLTKKEALREAQLAAYKVQQRDIAQKQRAIEKFRASTRASQAQSMMKQLERIELIEIDPPLPTVRFSFPPVQRAGRVVLKIDDVGKSFGSKVIFKHVSFEIERGEKVALVAANGVGKTTLFNVLTGSLPADEPDHVAFGYNVAYAVFEQDQARVLKPTNTIFEEVVNAARTVPESTIRAFLGSFLFTGDDVHKKIAVLSGGERNRVAMVKVLLQQANFLLLDEPTNHLDLYAKDILLQALQAYDGTILFVSHDHDFINKLATRVIELTPQGVYSFAGTFETYLWHKQQQQHEQAHQQQVTHQQQRPTSGAEQPAVDSKQLRDLKKQLARIEKEIEKCERELVEQAEIFGQHPFESKEHQNAMHRTTQLNNKLAKFSEEWEQLTAQIEQLT